MTELLRQIIGIHVLIGRDKGLAGTALDKLQIAAPFVLYPNGVEILRLGAQHHHDLCAVQGCKNVRFILLAQLVLQRNAAEEHLKALTGQLVIQIVGQHAVRSTLALGIRLLVADEHIEGLFFLGDVQNALLDVIDGLGLCLIDALLHTVSILQGRLIVIIRKDGGELGAVDSGDALLRGRILHVFDAVAAQHQRPVGFRVSPVILQDLLEDAHCLVVFVIPAEMVGSVVQIQPALVVQLRDGLYAAAVFTFTGRGVLCGAKVPAAHFALDEHWNVSSCLCPGLLGRKGHADDDSGAVSPASGHCRCRSSQRRCTGRPHFCPPRPPFRHASGRLHGNIQLRPQQYQTSCSHRTGQKNYR